MPLNLDDECNKRGSPGKLMLMMCMLLRMRMIATHILNVPRQARDNNNDKDNYNVWDSLCNKRGPGKPVITNTRSGAIATAHFTSMEIKKCNWNKLWWWRWWQACEKILKIAKSFYNVLLQSDGEDELKKRQLMELAIINGTYRDSSSKNSSREFKILEKKQSSPRFKILESCRVCLLFSVNNKIRRRLYTNKKRRRMCVP